MSEIKQINTGVAELLAVKVPEGAHSFIIKGGSLIYDDNGKESWWPQVYLPSNNWQILGLSDHLSEEVYNDIVQKASSSRDWNNNLTFTYKYYLEDNVSMETAKESFSSLMRANDCFKENPYPKPADDDYSFYTDRNVSVQEEWQQAEANTGTWLILKRLS